MRKLRSAVVSRGSHVQNDAPRLRAPERPRDEADGAEDHRDLGPGARERVARVGRRGRGTPSEPRKQAPAPMYIAYQLGTWK